MRCTRRFAFAGLMLALGCSELPELSYEGEHVRVGTDFDAPLCAGNIRDLDEVIEHVEAQLELGGDQKSKLYILADEELIRSICTNERGVCAQGGAIKRALVSREFAYRQAPHELAHDRVHRAPRKAIRKTTGLFAEGIAEAFIARCEPSASSWPDAQSLLEARTGTDMSGEGYILAGQLTRHLLQTHGSQKLQDFVAAVNRGDDPEAVRRRYGEYFGGSIDDDLHDKLDWSLEDRHPYELGCMGERAPVDESGRGYELRATLDCSSEKVRSNYWETDPARSGLAYVEWLVEPDSPHRYDIFGELPEGTSLRIERCGCIHGGDWPDPTRATSMYAGRRLDRSPYRVVWTGPLDGLQELDIRLVARCSALDDCPADQSCEDGFCVLPTGFACSQSTHEPSVCSADATCLGVEEDEHIEGWCVQTCTADAECSGGEQCGSLGVCGPPCDLLAQDCEPGWACQPGSPPDPAVCVPSGELGLLEPCEDAACAAGLVCESLAGVPGCEAPSRCCTSSCKPGPGAVCPDELPSCEPSGGGAGSCQL